MATKKRLSLFDMMEDEKILAEVQQADVVSNVTATTVRKTPILNMTDNSGKDKQISAKVNEKVYGLFTQINKAQGISNNSALNMIISRYVRENKGILEEDLFI